MLLNQNAPILYSSHLAFILEASPHPNPDLRNCRNPGLIHHCHHPCHHRYLPVHAVLGLQPHRTTPDLPDLCPLLHNKPPASHPTRLYSLRTRLLGGRLHSHLEFRSPWKSVSMLEHVQEHIASVILAALSICHFIIIFDRVPGTATIRCHIVPLHWDHVQARFIPAP